MRLRKRDLKPYKYFKRQTVTEDDGTTYEDWVGQGTFEAHIQPAGGRTLAEMYGERLAYMLACYTSKNVTVDEGCAVCVFTTGKPDYKVVAVRGWEHKVIDLEKIRG